MNATSLGGIILKYKYSYKLTAEQIQEVFEMVNQEWWAKDRNLEDFKKAVLNSSIIFAMYNPVDLKIVAFARVISDTVYKAILLDVVVDSRYRKQGIGRILLEHITNHPVLKSILVFDLFCMPEMVPFYEKWGFTDDLGPNKCMRVMNNH